jgi:hypothetical protein
MIAQLTQRRGSLTNMCEWTHLDDFDWGPGAIAWRNTDHLGLAAVLNARQELLRGTIRYPRDAMTAYMVLFC